MEGCQVLPEERCGNCKYFCKHYFHLEEGGYHAANFGHCVHPRLKNSYAEGQCQYFSAKEEENPRGQ